MALALRLASAGYCGGDPERVLQMRADLFVGALQYEKFKDDYQNTFIEMNREAKP